MVCERILCKWAPRRQHFVRFGHTINVKQFVFFFFQMNSLTISSVERCGV